jgi:hypothetical protein
MSSKAFPGARIVEDERLYVRFWLVAERNLIAAAGPPINTFYAEWHLLKPLVEAAASPKEGALYFFGFFWWVAC